MRCKSHLFDGEGLLFVRSCKLVNIEIDGTGICKGQTCGLVWRKVEFWVWFSRPHQQFLDESAACCTLAQRELDWTLHSSAGTLQSWGILPSRGIELDTWYKGGFNMNRQHIGTARRGRFIFVPRVSCHSWSRCSSSQVSHRWPIPRDI